jgi:hypothetical protein
VDSETIRIGRDRLLSLPLPEALRAPKSRQRHIGEQLWTVAEEVPDTFDP